MKVYKIADIVEGEVTLTEKGKSRPMNFGNILTNLAPAENPNLDFIWKLEMEIGRGPGARLIQIDLPPLISMTDLLEQPLFIAKFQLVFFRNRLFMPERPPKSATDSEEIILRVRKAVYDEDAEIVSLRVAVANLEATIEFTKSGSRREPIPEDVKLVVWARDGGACVRCGSNQNLHFDHIIPVAKGGGNTEANVQVLCKTCNLKKSDKIATIQ
jgi:HNH endonuclease